MKYLMIIFLASNLLFPYGHQDKGKYLLPSLGRVDSVIGDYRITYEILNNINDLIPTTQVTDVTRDTLYYASADVLLCLKKNDRTYLKRKFCRKDFLPFIEVKDIPYYGISSISIEGVKDDSISISFGLCMPDTDICYDFIIRIGEDGGVNIQEVYVESDVFSE